MKTLAGPEISFLTSCCDLKQNEQYRVFFRIAGLADCGIGWSAAVGDNMTIVSCQDGPDCQVIPDE
jgi:hypothetical protein